MAQISYGYRTAMALLRYDNPDVSVPYGAIAWLSSLLDCVPLGGEASLPNLEGKQIYWGEPFQDTLKGCQTQG